MNFKATLHADYLKILQKRIFGAKLRLVILIHKLIMKFLENYYKVTHKSTDRVGTLKRCVFKRCCNSLQVLLHRYFLINIFKLSEKNMKNSTFRMI